MRLCRFHVVGVLHYVHYVHSCKLGSLIFDLNAMEKGLDLLGSVGAPAG